MEQLFLNIFNYFKSNKIVFWICIGLSFIFLGITASQIQFEEDIAKILPKSEESEEISRVLESVKFADKTVIMIQAEENLEYSDQFAEDFLQIINQDTNDLFSQIQGEVDGDQFFNLLDRIESHLPLFLDSSDYTYLEAQLHPDSIQKNVEQHALEAFDNTAIYQGISSFREDPFNLIPKALEKFSFLQGGSNFKIESNYIKSKDSKTIFIFLTPKNSSTETDKNVLFVNLIEKTLDSLNRNYEDLGVKSQFFGSTAIAVANADQIKNDIKLSLSIALIILLFFFIYFYRKFYIPIIILIPVIFGSLLGISVLYWVKGTISAVSIGIGSVLLGLTLDYSLHILSHYRKTKDIKVLLKSTTTALIMCAVFTAVDFLCLLFLRSEVLQDLGIFAAVSVLGSAFFSLIFIPQVYHPNQAFKEKENTWVDKISSHHFEKNPYFVGLSFLLIGISLFTYKNVGFENNLDNLHYQPPQMKEAMQEFESHSGGPGKGLYWANYGSDWDEVLENQTEISKKLKKLKREGVIESFSSVGDILLSSAEQEIRLEKWVNFWNSKRTNEVFENLHAAGRHYGFKENTYQPFFEKINFPYTHLDMKDSETMEDLQLSEWVQQKDNLFTLLSTVKIAESQNLDLVKAQLTQASALVIDRKEIQETFLKNIEDDFDNLIWITSIAMFLVIFLFFRSVELTLITNIPVFLGWLVTLGLMGIFQVNFNAFNIIIATLVFGLGIDYSIFITKALLEKYTYGKVDMSAYRSGILMSALATLLCFGILIFAKHPAITSIAVIPLIGLGVVVLMSFTIQPLLFNFFIQNQQNKGNKPRTIIHIFWTIYTFGYFFGGGLLLSLFCQFYLGFGKSVNDKKLEKVHKWMQYFFKGMMYSSPNCKIRILNYDKKLFEKPVIIITNHTSQLDTPTVGMLHEKLIFVVNQRVLNSRFFGKTIQNAGFYSTENTHNDGQIEDKEDNASILALKNKVKKGYSIIIFPEGTRSRTGEIGRFKKGAFLLSEKLGLDVLPVLIHGNTDLLPKNDNILKPGDVTIKFLPIIKAQDLKWGVNYRERSKSISAYFKNEFKSLKNVTEKNDYFWSKLKLNYIYKSSSIRKEVKKDFAKYKHFAADLNLIIPDKSSLFISECHLGVLNILLAYHNPSQQILGWSSTAENLQIAQNTYTANRYSLLFPHSKEQLNVYLEEIKPQIWITKNNANLDDLEIDFKHLKMLILEDVETIEDLNSEQYISIQKMNMKHTQTIGIFKIYEK